MEIEQQTGLVPTEPKIAQDLSIMDRQEPLDGFYLQHQFILNNNIEPITAVQPSTSIDER